MITKRLLFLLLALTISLPVAKAQFLRVEEVPRHDLSLNMGFGYFPGESHFKSCPALHNSGLAPGAITITDPSESSFIVSINGFYMRNFLKRRLGVGLQFNYYSVDDTDNHQYLSEYYRGTLARYEESGFNIMPTIRCYWWNHNHLGLYSRLAAGINFHTVKEVDYNLYDDIDFNCGTSTTTNFAYQLSLVGAEVGGHRVRAFAEWGYGYQGIFSLGVRVKIGYKDR